MNEPLRSNLFRHIRETAVPGHTQEDVQRAWELTDQILPFIQRAIADEVEEAARLECVVLEKDPWDQPVLVPRREVLRRRVNYLRSEAKLHS